MLHADWSTSDDRYQSGLRVEFRLPEQAPADSVPRCISSGSEERATEFYP